MKLLITGDLVINQNYNITNIDASVISLFEQSSLNIVNLEAPVTDSVSKIDKTGPNLKSHKESTEEVLKALSVNIVTLANNHILDYDEQGVKDTLDFCEKIKVKTVGAGMNLQEASKILYIDTIEGKIAIVNFAENEWTSATEKTAGSNPMDLIDNFKKIKEAKEKADFVIVIVHGGNEYNHYPSPRMVKQYRFYAENGADAVIGHHTHCISGYETHNNVPILYSIGNFLFTKKSTAQVWYTGLIASLNIQKGKNIQFNVIPIEQSEEAYKLSFPNESKSSTIYDQIEEINKVISDPMQLETKWQEFIKRVEPGFMKRISPLGGFKNRYINAILYKSGIYKMFLNRVYLKEHLNRIRCEAHYDVTKQMLNNKLLKK